jgi:hypothetical protein
MDKQALGDLLRESNGLRTTDKMKSTEGVGYRIVAVSPQKANVVVPGYDVTVGLTCNGGVENIDASSVSSLVDLAVNIVTTVVGIVTGACKPITQIDITYDPKTFEMTIGEEHTVIQCD